MQRTNRMFSKRISMLKLEYKRNETNGNSHFKDITGNLLTVLEGLRFFKYEGKEREEDEKLYASKEKDLETYLHLIESNPEFADKEMNFAGYFPGSRHVFIAKNREPSASKYVADAERKLRNLIE